MTERETLDRRTVLRRTAATAGTLAVAGCLGEDDTEERDEETDDVELPDFPQVEDPPDAVYVPTHRESMRMLEPVTAGEYTVAPMLSYPHPFWILTGGNADDEIEPVDPEDGRGVHMMFTLWDEETGVVLPIDSGAQIRVSRDGERVGSPRSPWAMISQEMGFHFGDNVPLEKDGTYAVDLTLPPISTRLTGDLEGRFTESVTATFEFEYDEAFREEVVGGVEYFDEEYWGRRGALEPMGHGSEDDSEADENDNEHDDDRGNGSDENHDDHDHDHAEMEIPYAALPEPSAYPGTLLTAADDLPRSGDAAFVATLLETGSRLAEGNERYLLVSPRTPYNRVPLADTALQATIERDGETIAEERLEQTIDDEFDLHYGLSVADVSPGDMVRIAIESPPQVARHQGYETAFLEMEPVELEVPQ